MLGKVVQRRNIGRWLREPSTMEGLTILGTLVAGAVGVPPEVVTAAIGVVAANAVRRAERVGGE